MEVVGGAGAAEGVTRVLVVDDSPVDRRVAQLLLSSSSCAGAFHGRHEPHSGTPPLHLSSLLLLALFRLLPLLCGGV